MGTYYAQRAAGEIKDSENELYLGILITRDLGGRVLRSTVGSSRVDFRISHVSDLSVFNKGKHVSSSVRSSDSHGVSHTVSLPMSNSRRINLIADARGAKRQRLSLGGSYHDRVVEPHDMEVVNAREAHLGSRRQNIETPRSPQKGRTTWVVGETWTVDDDPELGLDPGGGGWFDEELEKDVMAPPRPFDKPVKKKKRSRVSVRILPFLRC